MRLQSRSVSAYFYKFLFPDHKICLCGSCMSAANNITMLLLLAVVEHIAVSGLMPSVTLLVAG